MTTVSPGFDKDARSHRLSAGSWLGVAYLSGSTTPSMSHWFPYLPLDFGQRSVLQPPVGEEELFMRIITHLGKPLLDGKDMLEVLAESRSVCFAQKQETALQWFLLHQKTLCSQPWNPHGCQVRAISQCLSVMKGFHHTAWPERAQAELAMAPFIPGPQTQQHSAGTALPGVEETLQLSVPAQLGTAREGRAIL